MRINISIDIEDAIRSVLSSYMTTYCRPLPKNFSLPCIEVHRVGGADDATIDSFEVVLDSRANNEADADEILRKAVGILKAVAGLQTSELRHVSVNSIGSWGMDPVRPELAMCSARLTVVAHQKKVEVS